jgi:hypothetical protein
MRYDFYAMKFDAFGKIGSCVLLERVTYMCVRPFLLLTGDGIVSLKYRI